MSAFRSEFQIQDIYDCECLKQACFQDENWFLRDLFIDSIFSSNRFFSKPGILTKNLPSSDCLFACEFLPYPPRHSSARLGNFKNPYLKNRYSRIFCFPRFCQRRPCNSGRIYQLRSIILFVLWVIIVYIYK